MEKQPAAHSPASSMVRNIIIGVITPVLAATIIYFLNLDNKSDKAEFKKKQQATVQSWTSMVQNKSIFTSILKQLGNSEDIDAMRNTINHELDITVGNMENIKKETNADQRVYSAIDVVVQQVKDIKPLMNKFLDDFITYANTSPTEEEVKTFALKLGEDLKIQMAGLRQRDSLRLTTFYEGLNKDYDITLPRY
jgi:hypothetical protein